VFDNLQVRSAIAAGGELKHIAKLNVFLTDLSNFAAGERRIMAEYFRPAVSGARGDRRGGAAARRAVEMDAVLVLD
jgi:enamine deaminase RidA (YjgF/YER057c/UK114 family)